MPVPETAVHEDGGPVFPQDDVRMSGQAGTVDPVSVAAAERNLRTRSSGLVSRPLILDMHLLRCSLVILSMGYPLSVIAAQVVQS